MARPPESNEIRAGRHCRFLMHVHLVFVSKYRRCVFTKNHLDTMKHIFTKICSDYEAELVEFDGEKDHVHLLVNYPPKVAISKLVNSLKGVSSRKLRQSHSDIHQYYWKGVLWSPSYFAGSCGGAPISVIRQYIEQQKTPH
jgi:putative transposase